MAQKFALSSKSTDTQSMEHVVHKSTLAKRDEQAAADLRYWLSQPMEARLAEVERLRELAYPGYARQDFQRVCKIVPLKGNLNLLQGNS